MIKAALTLLSGAVALGNSIFNYFRDKGIEDRGVQKQVQADQAGALHEVKVARNAADSDVVADFVREEYDATANGERR